MPSPGRQRGSAAAASRGSGSGSSNSSARGYDEDRLQQVMSRMRTALQLGLRSSSIKKDGVIRWGNTDAQVQGQVVRAIAAFVAVIPLRPFPLSPLQTAFEEAVAALEYLLSVEQEVIYKQAAGASVGMAGATQGRYMLRLLPPLAFLLAPSKALQAAVSAAKAMQSILALVRPHKSTTGGMVSDEVWEILHDADTLKNVMWRLDMTQNNNTGGAGVAEFAELLAMLLERWPAARYKVGSVEAVRSSLLGHCMSGIEANAVAGLRACQALVLCAGVAALQLESGEALWETVAHCLNQSQALIVVREALRLLSLLGRSSSFSASFDGPHMRSIVEGCLRVIREGNKLRCSVAEKGVVVEAAFAISVILRWAGDHHSAFLELGIVRALFKLLSERESSMNTKSSEDMPEKVDNEWKFRGAAKVTSSLWPLLWEIVGCLAIHCGQSAGKAEKYFESCDFGGLLVYACATLLRALHKNGHSTSMFSNLAQESDISSDEQQMSNQELFQICRIVFILLSSPCQVLSTSTKGSLENVLRVHEHAWLPRLADSLALGHTGPSLVKPDNVQTATNLFALACFSHLPVCQEFLLQGKALEVVMAIINIHAESSLAEETVVAVCTAKWSASHARAGIAVKTCCEEITENWEGGNAVLFASVCAFAKLAQGSAWARNMASTYGAGTLNGLNCSKESHGNNTVSLLWRLAEGATIAAGVQWWAACGLACFQIYGFPSALGRDIGQVFDESSFADIIFVLRDGGRLHVHSIILAVRCPSLLPGNFSLSRKAVEDPVLHEIHLSERISYQTLKSLLEFVYSGVVHIELEEVDNVRVLARRCGLESLTNLLHARAPQWGLPPASCDLVLALDSPGCSFTDIILRGKPPHDGSCESRSTCGLDKDCQETWTHVHAHRVVLSSRCEYLQALFRSGMRDSFAEAINVNLYNESLKTLLHYWYTGKLTRLTQSKGWCAWNNLDTHMQISYLQGLIELAQWAGQWLIINFQEECCLLVLEHLKGCNLHLGPNVIRHAATCEQWDLVQMCATCIAPAYTHLRDSGALEILDEGLKEVLRTTHVQFTLSDSQLDAG